jgi:hypothetical protein
MSELQYNKPTTRDGRLIEKEDKLFSEIANLLVEVAQVEGSLIDRSDITRFSKSMYIYRRAIEKK